MRLLKSWAFWITVLLLAGAVGAQADVTMTLHGVGGANQHGVYVAPYYFTIDPDPNWIGMMCDDFLSNDHIPETYQAHVSTIADLSQTRFYGTAGVIGYEEAFWLYDQYLAHPEDAININFAVWAIFDPALVGNATYWDSIPDSSGNTKQDWLDAAQSADLSNYDFSHFEVYTPTFPTDPQEMIHKTPEPATLALVGAGLVSGWVRRRKIA